MKIEKRLQFGFRGDWGTLYKRYTATDNPMKITPAKGNSLLYKLGTNKITG